jgi:hypothetical protein
MKIPTLKDMLGYQTENPKLSGIDVASLYEAYEASAGKNHKGEKVWVDSRGRIIGNWRLKMHTLSQYSPPKLCGICHQPASKFQMREGKKFYLCPKCLPIETPTNPNPVKRGKDEEMIMRDKAQEQIKKLALNMGR